MGHLGPVQARYDVLPVPALSGDDAAAPRHEPADLPIPTPTANQRRAEPRAEPVPTAGD